MPKKQKYACKYGPTATRKCLVPFGGNGAYTCRLYELGKCNFDEKGDPMPMESEARMNPQWTIEDLLKDAEALFKKLGGTGNPDARIVDRMRRLIAAYALTSNLSTEYIIRMSQEVSVLALDQSIRIGVC